MKRAIALRTRKPRTQTNKKRAQKIPMRSGKRKSDNINFMVSCVCVYGARSKMSNAHIFGTREQMTKKPPPIQTIGEAGRRTQEQEEKPDTDNQYMKRQPNEANANREILIPSFGQQIAVVVVVGVVSGITFHNRSYTMVYSTTPHVYARQL